MQNSHLSNGYSLEFLRLFFIFLTGKDKYLPELCYELSLMLGTGMLTCVHPFLSQDLVTHILKNIIKAFLATFIGLPFLKIASGRTELTQVTIVITRILSCNFYMFQLQSAQDDLSSFPDSSSGGDSGIFRSQSRDLFQINRDDESTYRKRSK